MADGLQARHGVVLRVTSGAIAVVDHPMPLVALEKHRRAVIHIVQEANLTTPDGDDRVRFHIETAYGAGDFAASGELLDEAADIDDTQPTFTVDDTTTFVPGDVIRLDQEWMLVTAVDGAAPGVLAVERGYENTPRAAHVNNVVINLLDVNWIEVAQVTYDNADNGTSPQCVVVIGGEGAGPQIADDLDAALADDTVLALPLGDRLRLRTTIAGASAPTYNYSARAAFQN